MSAIVLHFSISRCSIKHTHSYCFVFELSSLLLPLNNTHSVLTMSTIDKAPHIAILPSPGMGHFIPLSELAKRLVHHHDLSITIMISTTTKTPPKALSESLKTLPENINHQFLPPVNFDDLPEDSKAETQIFLTMTRSLSSIRVALQSLMTRTRLVALIIDPFGTDAIDLARELNILPYLFFTSNAMNLSFSFVFPKLDETVSCEFRDLPEPVKIPGCVLIHGRDLLDPVQDRSNPAYKGMLHHAKRFHLVEGIFVNSFIELEEGAIRALQGDQEPGIPLVYPIGPLIQSSPSSIGLGRRVECLDWLDNQPSESVLFVAFGSGGTLSSDQLNELALGLEISGQRFLWVVRCPNDLISNGAFFNPRTDENDPLGFLPKGFLDRTNGQGLVVSCWAPQIEVLKHDSIGGFVTHCGWNSVLESIVYGVPMIAWPLYAEQKMNAVMLTEGLDIAIRPKANENGIVEREEVERIVRRLMEGEDGKRIGRSVKGLKEAAMEVLSENGYSNNCLSELALKWKNEVGI